MGVSEMPPIDRSPSETPRHGSGPRPTGAPAGDRRLRALFVLGLAGLVAWLAVRLVGGTAPLPGGSTTAWTTTTVELAIGLAVVPIVVVLVPSAIVIVRSRRLRAGEAGAIVSVLALPLVLLVAIAGVCIWSIPR